MLPSQLVTGRATESVTITDESGRRLVVRCPTALDTLRLFKAAGPVLSLNDSWLALANLAFCVEVIDDVPVPQPTSEQQIEAVVARLGDHGLAAVSRHLESSTSQTDVEASVGNLPGTPS